MILQYIADQKPESGLIAKAGTLERYHTQEWLNYISTEIHKNYSKLFGADRMIPNPEGSQQLRNSTKETLGVRFAYICEKLGNGNYLMGSRLPVADAYLYTCLRWSQVVSVDLTKWPKLEEFMARVSARPHVREAMAAEGIKH